jgi:2-dehydropantoate 2-reductase
VSPERIKQVQLQKLVVDAAINPLSALFKCKNGDVFNSEARMHLLTRLVEEAGPIVRALLKSPGPEFDDSALREEVLRVARATGENTSSMLQDVEAGRKTEIDYLNGYLVARAKTKKLRLPRTYHAALVRMVSTPEAEWLPEDLELIQAARGG